MIPSKHSRSLYFPPRTPWSRHPQNRPGQGGQTPPNTQGQPLKGPPAAQKKPYDPRPASDRDILRGPGDVAPSVKEQLQREIELKRREGYTSDRNLTLQQKYERDNLMEDTFQPKPVPPPTGIIPKILNHVDGDVSYEGKHPGTDERPSKELRLRFSTQPKQRGELPSSGPPEKNQGDEANRKYLYPAESPEGTQEPAKPFSKLKKP